MSHGGAQTGLQKFVKLSPESGQASLLGRGSCSRESFRRHLQVARESRQVLRKLVDFLEAVYAHPHGPVHMADGTGELRPLGESDILSKNDRAKQKADGEMGCRTKLMHSSGC
jgi:hypothetical protein